MPRVSYLGRVRPERVQGLSGLAARHGAAGVCRLCWHPQRLSIDGLCRLCLITLRSQGRAPDFDDALGPEDAQLMLHMPVGRRGLAPPLSHGGVRPRSQRRNVRTGRTERPYLDDPGVIPAAMPGQGVLFPARRRIDSLRLARIRGRTWPELPQLAALAAEVAAERQLSGAWLRQVLKLVRAVLSMRDADGARLVAEEYFDQVPKDGIGGAVEVLRRSGLLIPRSRRNNRWPMGSCGHCGCWGVTAGLCRGCESWKHESGRYPQADCAQCTRILPVSTATGLCRGCLIHIREYGPYPPGPHPAPARPRQAPRHPAQAPSPLTRLRHHRHHTPHPGPGTRPAQAAATPILRAPHRSRAGHLVPRNP